MTSNKFKFTKPTIDAIPTPTPAQCGAAGYVQYHDTVQPGLRLKVTPNGTKTFVWAYRNDSGKQKKLKLGRYGQITVEQAREAYKHHAGKLAAGTDPAAEKVKAKLAASMAELFDAYLDQHIGKATNPQTQDAARRALGFAKTELGNLTVIEIKRSDVMRARDKLAGKPGAQNVFVNYVRASINWGRDRGYYPEDRLNPAQAIKENPGTPMKKEITEDQFRRIGNAIREALSDNKNDPSRLLAAWFVALTGCRPVETMRMKPQHVDEQAGTITLPPDLHKTGRKTGKDRVWYITPEIQEVLDRAKTLRDFRGQHEFLFARRGGVPEKNWFTHSWKALCRRAGVSGVVLYQFRSAVATAAVDELDLNDAEAMDLTGHQNHEVWKKHYRMSRPKTTRANTEAMTRNQAAKLFGSDPQPEPPAGPGGNVVPLFKRAG